MESFSVALTVHSSTIVTVYLPCFCSMDGVDRYCNL